MRRCSPRFKQEPSGASPLSLPDTATPNSSASLTNTPSKRLTGTATVTLSPSVSSSARRCGQAGVSGGIRTTSVSSGGRAMLRGSSAARLAAGSADTVTHAVSSDRADKKTPVKRRLLASSTAGSDETAGTEAVACDGVSARTSDSGAATVRSLDVRVRKRRSLKSTNEQLRFNNILAAVESVCLTSPTLLTDWHTELTLIGLPLHYAKVSRGADGRTVTHSTLLAAASKSHSCYCCVCCACGVLFACVASSLQSALLPLVYCQ